MYNRKKLQRNKQGNLILLVFFFCFLIQSNSIVSQTRKPVKRQTKITKPLKPTKPSIYPRPITVAEGYQSSLENPGEILKPEDASENKKYPLLIFLPFTGGTAEYYFKHYQEVLNLSDSYVIMLTPEPASENDHTWQGFEAATYRYENRILQDLKNLKAQQIIDTTKIIIAGFSMGGDMSWAIAQRHPQIFKGAIIGGSRTSWQEKNAGEQIKKFGLKYYFSMGTEESETRLNGLKNTLNLLDKNGIPYKYERIDGEHVPMSPEMLQTALQFLLN